MGFFDQVIDRDWLRAATHEESPPAWAAPPANEVPVCVPLYAPIVQQADVVVWLSGARAYTAGIAFELELRWRAHRPITRPFIPGNAGRNGLCVGVIVGEASGIVARRPVAAEDYKDCPSGPVLVSTSARHGARFATVDLWLWQRTGGRATWIVEWRRHRIAESRGVTDLTPVANAGAKATVIWQPDPISLEEAGGTR
jgi:hypothetical protein